MPIQVSVVTPEREVWSGEAEFVVARAEAGDLGVLPGHAPFLGALRHERLIVRGQDTQQHIAVHGGFIEVFENQVTVLTQSAELAEEIDNERAQRQKEEAERALLEEDSYEHRLALLRAANRLKTAAEAGLTP